MVSHPLKPSQVPHRSIGAYSPHPLMSLSLIGPFPSDQHQKPRPILGPPRNTGHVKDKHSRINNNNHYIGQHSNTSLLNALNQFYNRPPATRPSDSLTMPNQPPVPIPVSGPIQIPFSSQQITFGNVDNSILTANTLDTTEASSVDTNSVLLVPHTDLL